MFFSYVILVFRLPDDGGASFCVFLGAFPFKFHQDIRPGIPVSGMKGSDATKIFDPVPRFSTVFVMLLILSSQDLCLPQFFLSEKRA